MHFDALIHARKCRCSTWNMFLRAFYFIFAVLLLIGCNKPDPEAYRSDPILQDYKAQLAATIASSEALKKQIEGIKKDRDTSVPQTGQFRLHNQKYFDMQNRLANLEQQIRFWKIRIQSQAQKAQKDYLLAHEKNEVWPDPAKTEAYFAEKRLRQAKMKWDQKDRIDEAKKSADQTKKPADAGQ